MSHIGPRQPASINDLEIFWTLLNQGGGSGGGTGGGGAAEILHPFKLSAGTGDLTCQVRYGTLNDIEPSPIAIDIELTDEATNYVYIEATIDDAGEVTDADILAATTEPTEDDYTAAIVLGTIVCGSGAITIINQAVTHSLRFRACDRDMDNTEPGTYHFWGV